MPNTSDFESYVAMAEAGDAQAQIYVGWAYLAGKLVERNQEIGEKWLRKASDQGSLEGGYRLAMVLLQRRDKEAIGLFKQLGDRGYAPANYELGNCLYTGNLVERDTKAAAIRWNEARRKGHAVARIKFLKYQSSLAPLHEKPLFAVRIFISLVRAIWLYLRNDQDERVLGTFS